MYGRRALPRKLLCLNRDDEFAEFRRIREQALAAASPVFVAVSGNSGVGKTTLLNSLVYRHRDQYTDVLYYDAGAHGGTSAAEIAMALLVQLGVPWREVPDPDLRITLLRSMLADRSVLIALDDIRSAEQVLPLLGDLGDAAILVAGEKHLHRLRIAEFESLHLQGFKPADSVAYLARLAGPAVHDTDPAVLDRLAALVGRVPLLIAALAARLADGDEPAEEYADRLARATLDEVADELSIDGDPVGIAVCEAGYRGLSPAAARAYRWLSWTTGRRFDLETAAALLESSVPVAKRAVRELVDRALVLAVDDETFEFPAVMRKHANQTSVAHDLSPAPVEIERRAIGLCVTRAVSLAKTLSERPIPATEPAAVFAQTPPRYDDEERGAEWASAEFATAWDGFVAAARRATRLGLAREAVTLWIALWPFGYQTFRTAELIDGYRALVDTPPPLLDDPATRWQVLRDLGALYEKHGEPGTGADCIRRAAALNFAPGTASILEWEALQHEGLGARERAIDLLAQARAAVPMLPDPAQRQRSIALIDMHCGRILLALGRPDDATGPLTAAEGHFRTRPRDANNAARCQVLLGDIARAHGATAAATAHWTGAAEVLTRYGMLRTAADVHDKLEQLAKDQGRVEEAHRQSALAARLRAPR